MIIDVGARTNEQTRDQRGAIVVREDTRSQEKRVSVMQRVAVNGEDEGEGRRETGTRRRLGARKSG